MKKFQTIGDKIFWQFTVFPRKFESPQAKRNFISITINFVYELPHELPHELLNNLRIWI